MCEDGLLLLGVLSPLLQGGLFCLQLRDAPGGVDGVHREFFLDRGETLCQFRIGRLSLSRLLTNQSEQLVDIVSAGRCTAAVHFDDALKSVEGRSAASVAQGTRYALAGPLFRAALPHTCSSSTLPYPDEGMSGLLVSEPFVRLVLGSHRRCNRVKEICIGYLIAAASFSPLVHVRVCQGPVRVRVHNPAAPATLPSLGIPYTP